MPNNTISAPYKGMNLDFTPSRKGEGVVSYSLNAVVEGGINDSMVVYQNEPANELCASFPEGYKYVGGRNIIEKNTIVVFLFNPQTGESEIGTIISCSYKKLINANCLNFSLLRPIHKIMYRINNGNIEIYWVDGNSIRMLDFSSLPYKEIKDECNTVITDEIDCNKLDLQPNFSIPEINIEAIEDGGENTAGTYQFAIQYSNALGEAYTPYFSVSNPLSLFDPNKTNTLDFNYILNQAVRVKISNIDISSVYDYINIAVIKSVNGVSSAYIIATKQITGEIYEFTYSSSASDKPIGIPEIFQKYEIYNSADDITVANSQLILAKLKAKERISYQEIANEISLKWITYRMKGDKFFQKGVNGKYRGYMRDEIYAFEFVPLLKKGKQADGFHIHSRIANSIDRTIVSNNDTENQPVERWQAYNTASVNQRIPSSPSLTYEGEWETGEFAYWESSSLYPCTIDFGELQNTQILHHKFPDCLISPHFDNDGYIYLMGIRVDVQQVYNAIQNSSLTQEQKDDVIGFKIVRGNRANNESIKAKGLTRNVGKYEKDEQTYFFPNYPYNDLRANPQICSSQTTNDSGTNSDKWLEAFNTEDSKKRMVVNSPSTSFFSPALGNKIKLEQEIFGMSKGHFVPVQGHSQYKFPSVGAYVTGILLSVAIGVASATIGLSNNVFNGQAAFTAYQTFIDIIDKTTPRINYTYQYNSIGNYDNYKEIENNGNKIRHTDVAAYLIPGMQNVGDEHSINNFQRESSVYVKTSNSLPTPSTLDTSRIVNSDVIDCNTSISSLPISGYYASLYSPISNQYGELYSYKTIDTGAQFLFKDNTTFPVLDVFGGDVFINKFSFKTKLAFFIDNKMNSAPDADIDFRDFNNVGYPTYWMSSDSNDAGVEIDLVLFKLNIPFIPRKINNLDCDTRSFFYQKGKIYLFAYGIPTFWCESTVNVDMRQAHNGKEGDFFPHVSSDIPDEWLQEKNVSIINDNSYHYNKTYSKQNEENNFSHLFPGYVSSSFYSHRAIFSEPRTDSPNPSLRNNWLIFKPLSFIDFPQNYGELVSVDGIENEQVLVRMEGKTLLYNALSTIPTSTGEAYLGKPLFSQQIPPMDYADTDGGYIGTQNKLLLKTEYGHITTDSKRGKIFLLNGRNSKDITEEYVSKFFNEFFDFEIRKAFPSINVDDTLIGVGIAGVYDSSFKRIIITKHDAFPLLPSITYSNGEFYNEGEKVLITNPLYFCNYSFTISYSFRTQAWVAFHSYFPVGYITDANSFYSVKEDGIWKHNIKNKFNTFYGKIEPYILEHPYSFSPLDQIIQNVTDYTKALKHTDWEEYVESDEYFDEAILYSSQQCSGILKLVKKPSFSNYNKYPVYNSDSKSVIYTKTDDNYRINTFWDLVVNSSQPIWKKSCSSLSIQKELNQSNMSYSKRAYKKAPIRSRDLRVRMTLNSKNDIHLLSHLSVVESSNSYK